MFIPDWEILREKELSTYRSSTSFRLLAKELERNVAMSRN
jgi:hypothetical protein